MAVVLVLSSVSGVQHPLPNLPPPTAGPTWTFGLNLQGSSNNSSGYFYNISTAWMTNTSLTLSWVQFYVQAPAADQSVNVSVQATDGGGMTIGTYDTSNSTWRGDDSPTNVSFASFGGWLSGGSVPFSLSDVFHVQSMVSLSGRYIEAGIQLPSSARDEGIEWLLL